MQDPQIQQLKTAHGKLKKKINDLLEAHTKAVADPRLTPNVISALSAELDRILGPMYDEMHGIAEDLGLRGSAPINPTSQGPITKIFKKHIDILLDTYEKTLAKSELASDNIIAFTSEFEKAHEPFHEDIDRGVEMLAKFDGWVHGSRQIPERWILKVVVLIQRGEITGSGEEGGVGNTQQALFRNSYVLDFVVVCFNTIDSGHTRGSLSERY
ncbi:hypothetical protein HOY82DRAFT_612900 [Tuber indicum]|nr:hypothetical protein HOY82DRAFT_612900 [Tuber indicum]